MDQTLQAVSVRLDIAEIDSEFDVKSESQWSHFVAHSESVCGHSHVKFLDVSSHHCGFNMSSNAGASDVAALQSDQGPDWKKLEAKDILGCIQWKPGTYTVVVKEDNTPVTEDEVYHQHAWTYTMSIKGPGRDVSIRGTLKPLKRSAEEAGLPTGGPFTMVRDCDTMVAQIQKDAAVAAANQCEVQDTQEFDTVLDEETAERAEAAMGTPGTPGTPPSPQSWEESRKTPEAWKKDLKR